MLSIGFRIFCLHRGFCHRNEPDLLLFLFIIIRDRKVDIIVDVKIKLTHPLPNACSHTNFNRV